MKIKNFNQFVNESKNIKLPVVFSFNAKSIAGDSEKWWDGCQKELKKKALDIVTKKLNNKNVTFIKSSVDVYDCDLENYLVNAEVTLSGEKKDLNKLVGDDKFFVDPNSEDEDE